MTKAQLCTALACRLSNDVSTYHYTNGIGAADGTYCDHGKICLNMECVESPQASLSSPIAQTSDDCPFGDDMVINGQVIWDQKLPEAQMSCDQAMDFLFSLGLFAPAYCFQNPVFKATCCQTCKSKLNRPSLVTPGTYLASRVFDLLVSRIPDSHLF